MDPRTIVDVRAVHATAGGLEAGGPDTIDPAVLSADVLPGWDEEWLLSTREWFRQVRLHALEALCLRRCRDGRYGEALEAGMAAIACEPLRESAHRAVARAHLAEGNPAEAVRQYRLYQRLLHDELGLPPSVHFQELIGAISAAVAPR